MMTFAKVLRRKGRRFTRDQRGAVTVDWVVLTAALVVMAFSVFNIITRAIFEEAGVRMSETIVASSEWD